MTTLTHPQTGEAGRLRTLRRWNAGLSVLHLIQALAILALASSFSLPVTSSFLRMSTATNRLIAVPNELFRVRIGPLVAAFLLISAIAHAALASPRLHTWYERNLTRGIQPARWIEYALSSSLMMVVIAMLVGSRNGRDAATGRRRCWRSKSTSVTASLTLQTNCH